MKGNRAAFILVAAAAVMLAACLSVPPSTQQARAAGPAAAPSWVLKAPEADARYMYFTGTGESKSASIAEGEQVARGALLDEIMRYMGVRITSETTATARASLDSFRAEVVQTLKSTSSGRVAGLQIAERWLSERDGRLTVYLLARYDQQELAKEKRRLEEVFREKIEAISGPEREGRELEAQGRLYLAALRYLEAAAAAYKSELENADIRFERNLNQAREAIRRIGLAKLNDNLRTYAGQEFGEPFSAAVVNGSSPSDPPMPDVAVRIAYKEGKGESKPATRTRLVKSDVQGRVAFQPPAPEFVGPGELIMSLDLSDALEALEQVPDRLYVQVEAFQDQLRKKSVSFAYESLSPAAVVPLGIAVFDLDASDNPISMAETAAGLLSELGKASFKVTALPVSAGSVAGRQDAQVLAVLAAFQPQVRRVIFGTARISESAQEGNTLILQVTGTVKVLELATGKILLTVNRSKRAQGGNASAALAAAFKMLGEDLGKAIANQLR
jgi:hypothetical protein